MVKAYRVLGSALSPFTWKLLALIDHARLQRRFLPVEAGSLENLWISLRKEALVHGLLPLTWPRMGELDEFPLVPFLFGPNGENLYDSTAIAVWLDQQGLTARHGTLTLTEDPAAGFVAQLIDNYADEFLLYVVHHNRWVVSARDNTAGRRLGEELRPLLGPFAAEFGRRFAMRQVRRLPYLFSCAAPGTQIPDLPAALQPPALDGFPPTRHLLDEAFARLLQAIEPVYASRAGLFGDRFTLADASLYGALAMNLDDPSADRQIAESAPATHAWLRQIRDGRLPGRADCRPALYDDLQPLLDEIRRVYWPLQAQNHAAYLQYRVAGNQVWNEAAFRRRQALYDGVIDGSPYRSVVKTFQVATWQSLCAQWSALPSAARDLLKNRLPGHEVMQCQA